MISTPPLDGLRVLRRSSVRTPHKQRPRLSDGRLRMTRARQETGKGRWLTCGLSLGVVWVG